MTRPRCSCRGLRRWPATGLDNTRETIQKGTNRFGVKLIRNPLALSEDELLLETSDSAIRTLYCDIGSRDALPADLAVIETTWWWNVVQGEGQPVVMQTCAAACVPAVAEGHDLRHGHSGTDNDDNPIGPVYP